MARGIFGLPRLFDFGPLTFSQEADDTDEIRELLIEIIEDENIDPSTMDFQEFNQIRSELVLRMYPNGGEIFNTRFGFATEQQIFAACLASEWASLWESGFIDSTTDERSALEALAVRANGCTGIAGAGNAGIRTLGLTNIEDIEPIFN